MNPGPNSCIGFVFPLLVPCLAAPLNCPVKMVWRQISEEHYLIWSFLQNKEIKCCYRSLSYNLLCFLSHSGSIAWWNLYFCLTLRIDLLALIQKYPHRETTAEWPKIEYKLINILKLIQKCKWLRTKNVHNIKNHVTLSTHRQAFLKTLFWKPKFELWLI